MGRGVAGLYLFWLVYQHPPTQIRLFLIYTNIMYFDQQPTQEAEQQPETILAHYEIISCIAEGSFGKVYHCVSRANQSECAVKVIDKRSVKKARIDGLRNQARLLQMTSHPNIIKLRGFKQSPLYIFLQMDYIRHGTVGRLLKHRVATNNPLSSEQISSLMRGIFNGVNYLHSLNIIHRDLKTENVLLDDPEDLSKVKIADFGLSIQIEANSFKPYHHCGTLLFMAPEVIRKHPYTKSIDIWSCAVIMYMLFTGGQHPLGLKYRVSPEQYLELMNRRWPTLEDQLAQNFIQRISQFEPTDRYNSMEALKHPFLTRNQDDCIPLTYSQSFMSFEISHKTCSVIRSAFVLENMFERSSKITVDRSYLEKVEEYNLYSKKVKQRNIESRRGSKKTILASEDLKDNFTAFDIIRNASSSLHEDQTSSHLRKSPTNRVLNLISLSFVSQTDQCIKIRDLHEEQQKPQPISAKLPTKSKGFVSTKHQNSKLQQFLTNGSFSPTKTTSKQKKSIINFPKLPQFKIQQAALKKTHSNNRGSVSPQRITSPNKRPQSSRKYVKLITPEQLALRVFKS